MKKAYTRGEKLLFATPLLFLAIAGAAWQWRQNMPYLPEVPASHTVEAMEYSPDGRRLVALFRDKKTFRFAGRIYDFESPEKYSALEMPPLSNGLPNSLPVGRDYERLAWSPDGKSLAAAMRTVTRLDEGYQITLWDVLSGTVKADVPTPKPKYGGYYDQVRFSPDGKTLIVEGVPPTVYDATTGRPLNQADVGTPKNPREKLGIATVYDRPANRLRVVDTKTKSEVWAIKIKDPDGARWFWDDEILCLSDEPKASSGAKSGDSRLLLWNGKTRQLQLSPPILSGRRLGFVIFNPDKSTFAYVNFETRPASQTSDIFEGELVVWDYRINRTLWRTEITQDISEPAWSPDGKWLSVSGFRHNNSYDFVVFDKTGKRHFERETVSPLIRWSPDSKQLAIVVGHPDNTGNMQSSRLEVHRIEE